MLFRQQRATLLQDSKVFVQKRIHIMLLSGFEEQRGGVRNFIGEIFFVDIDADARHSEVEAIAGNGVLGKVAGELTVIHVQIVGPLDEDVGHIFDEETAGGGREPEVENELVGGGQSRLKVDAGEDVETARTVPFVAARPASRRLEVGVHSVEIWKFFFSSFPRAGEFHQEFVRGGDFLEVVFHFRVEGIGPRAKL